MDTNGDGSVTKEEAIAFWGSNFAKVSAAPPPCPVPRRRRRDADADAVPAWPLIDASVLPQL